MVWELADDRETAGDYEKKTEAFAMDDETFDGTIYNAAYQLNLAKRSGLCNAYLWLLTGSLLRNETGRVLRLYDSSFIAIRRQLSETGSLTDKLNYLLAHLNEQEGFDDHSPEWKCQNCGFANKLAYSEIYDNDEDRQNKTRPADPHKFEDATERRRQELNQGLQEDCGRM